MRTEVLPRHLIEKPARPVPTAATVAHFVTEHFLLLPLGAALALVWANTAPDGYFTFAHRMAFVVNDIGMALFVALLMQEIWDATVAGGALHTWRRWVLPIVAAAGGAAGAAAVYLGWLAWHYQEVLQPGWRAAIATDLVFTFFLARAVYRRHAAVPFVLLVGVATNVMALAAIAPHHLLADVRPGGAALMVAAIAAAYALKRFKVHSFWPYLFGAGTLSWAALYLDGLNPALALVPIVPFLPHARRSLNVFADAPHGAPDSPSHFEHVWSYPVQIALFLFGLVNAGVMLRGYDTGSWAILAAALAGRPIGMLLAMGIAVALGIGLPSRLHARDLVVTAVITSTGFTFALFAATAVFPFGPTLTELKFGALLTLAGVPLALAAARLLHVGRFNHHGRAHHAVHAPHVIV